MSQAFYLFVQNTFGGYISCLNISEDKLQRLYLLGQDRLEKECDIVKIIQGIRNLKIISKNTIMDKFTKVKV